MATYIKTPISEISNALNASEVVARDGERVTPSAVRNIIIFVPNVKFRDRLEEYLDILSQIQPARYFVMYRDSKITELQASVSTRGGDDGGGIVYSEVVRLIVPLLDFAPVAPVIRANLLPGVSTEVILSGLDKLLEEELSQIVPLGDKVIIDTGEQEGLLPTVTKLLDHGPTFVDLDWIRLSPWKDQIRLAFEYVQLKEQISQIAAIIIKVRSGENDRKVVPSQSLLLAGWIAVRLNLEVMAYGNSEFECRTSSGRVVRIRFEFVNSTSKVSQLDFLHNFDDPSESSSNLVLSISLSELFSSQSGVCPEYRQTAVADDLSLKSLLTRFYLQGESIRTYNAALRQASALESLKVGYSLV